MEQREQSHARMSSVESRQKSTEGQLAIGALGPKRPAPLVISKDYV